MVFQYYYIWKNWSKKKKKKKREDFSVRTKKDSDMVNWILMTSLRYVILIHFFCKRYKIINSKTKESKIEISF